METKIAMVPSPSMLVGAVGVGMILGLGLSRLGTVKNTSSAHSWVDSWRLKFAALVPAFLGEMMRKARSTEARETCSLEGAGAGETFRTSAKHLAIIMDGNRRFGKSRYGDALKGHWDGGEVLAQCVEWCVSLGLEALTVYAFSTENWDRPKHEVDTLMAVFLKYADQCEREAASRNVRITCLSSDRGRLPANVKDALAQMEERTALNTGFRLNLAVSYGARSDIGNACRRLCEEAFRGEIRPEQVGEEAIASRLSTAGLPPLDVVMRTSGEKRLSNFLLFESAYAELFFLDKFWPELTKADLVEVFQNYERRTRRFGT